MIRAAVIGAAGYTGGELAGILCAHPQAELVHATADSNAGVRLDALHPTLVGRTDLVAQKTDVRAIKDLSPDAVFLATPHEVSMRLAGELLGALDEHTCVLDLSGAFRLSDLAAYPQHYGFEHANQALVEQAIYGLVEFARPDLPAARLVAVPGCYATASICAIRPLVHANIVETDRPIVIDACSGVSGAGRGAKVENLFCEVSLRPYGVLSHRHQPEIAEHTGAPVAFVPHVGPWERGIIATVHATVRAGITEQAIEASFADAYRGSAFVRMLDRGEWPSVRSIAHTDRCDIAWTLDQSRNHLVVCSAVDNLRKGAASQAVQCMNVRFGLDETAGLTGASR